MIIPVRVRSDSPITIVGDSRPALASDHPLADRDCPVCDSPLTEGALVLVLVGIAPPDRKPHGGWTTGAAVAVHAACAGASA